MIKVINTDFDDDETTYPSVYDFLEDALTDGMVEEYLNEVYGNVEIIGEKVPAGEALRKVISDDRWQLYFDDYLNIECDYIEDELSTYGEVDFYQYTIIDLDYQEEN